MRDRGAIAPGAAVDAYEAYLEAALACASAAGAGAGSVPTSERPDEGCFVVRGARGLRLLYTERGGETLLVEGSPEALVFYVASGITCAMAQRYELEHRRPGEDTRRQWMADHVRRMAALRPSWGARQQAEYDEVLTRHPFDDQLARRAERWSELLRAGLDRDQAVAQATREFP